MGGMGAGGYTQILGGMMGGAGSILNMIGSQKSRKGPKYKHTSMPTFTDQGSAIQDALIQMLFNRLGTPRPSFAQYLQQGPQAQMTPGMVSPSNREALGLGMATIPQGVNPWVVQALQQIGASPNSPFYSTPGSPGYSGPLPTTPTSPMGG